MSEYFDEEGLLKVIKIFELSGEISKLNWGWNNHPDPIRRAHELMDKGQKLYIEISEYEQRIGPNLGIQQKKNIEDAMEDLGKLIPYMKNKIKPADVLKAELKGGVMKPEAVAAALARALPKGPALILPGNEAKLPYLINRFAPGLFERLVARPR